MPTLTAFIATYGYVAVFFGAVFEGETVLILGGFAVHEGYLSIAPLFLAAFLGAVVGDSSWFLLGKYRGAHILRRFPWFKKWAGQPLRLVHAKPRFLSFSMRFLYGFRNVVPFGLGMSPLPFHTFLVWNALGAILWTLTIGTAGYLFGDILEYALGNIRRYEFEIIVVAIAGLMTVYSVAKFGQYALRNILKTDSSEDRRGDVYQQDR